MDRKTVLIVEDERVNRRILSKLLEEHYDVLEAENGADAWALLSNQKDTISAILLDLVMPVMSGYELLALMREAGMEDLPVIVTTGTTDVEEEHRALDAGAWDFVTKPYNAKTLFSRLRNAIARSEVAAYEKLQYISEHDELTGLFNRRMMFSETRKMIDAHPDSSFLFIRFDIDRFALYNTSFGEKEGDELLQYMAEYIEKAAALQSYHTSSRIAADVFFICESFSGSTERINEKIRDTQTHLSAYRRDYRLELSTGIYVLDDPSLSIDECYFRTTVAAQRCKSQIDAPLAYYDARVGAQIAEEVAIINEMQTALDERQFVVYLQPKFSLPAEKICGAEALVRWQHPTRGMIPPGAFIPVFEKNGSITRLDYYVWEETCRMLHNWEAEGKPLLPVSVNISRISLYNPQLTEMMVGLVRKYQIAPSILQLEITESAYMTNPGLMEKTIESLHDAGFTILMDDFGSGYSSLNTLKRIQVDVLKVDMKFLPVKDETGRGEIILSSVIKMAGWLGMRVVVEGVETRRQRDFLDGAGCDYIQGYYYSKPIPQSEYEQLYLSGPAAEQAERAVLQAEEIVPQHNMTILVIDDSEIDRAVLQENFQELYHVHACENAEAGLAYLKRNAGKVRLIIVDNMMPGMSGLDFLHYCRQDSTLSAIPKIMITADGTPEDQVAAFREGAYDYITKPFIREIVAARVGHVMEISRRSTIFDSVEQEYEKKSELDAATQLLNKMAFKNLSARFMETLPDDQEALLVLDIDEFKQINDRYGHLAGDAVINCVAEELGTAFRKTDILGRFGGDEFVVLMTKLPNQEIAKRKAGELVKNVLGTCMKKLNISASISIGLAFSERNDTIDTLFARADQALYEAKNTGKGKTVVYGEKVPPILNNDKPIVLVCGEDPQLYPAIALAYGDSAAFASITSYPELVAAFERYQRRIRVICLDLEKKAMTDSDAFYQYILNHGGGTRIPIFAICREGNMEQLREAVRLEISDLLTLPPQADVIQRRLSSAIINSGLQYNEPAPDKDGKNV